MSTPNSPAATFLDTDLDVADNREAMEDTSPSTTSQSSHIKFQQFLLKYRKALLVGLGIAIVVILLLILILILLATVPGHCCYEAKGGQQDAEGYCYPEKVTFFTGCSEMEDICGKSFSLIRIMLNLMRSYR